LEGRAHAALPVTGDMHRLLILALLLLVDPARGAAATVRSLVSDAAMQRAGHDNLPRQANEDFTVAQAPAANETADAAPKPGEIFRDCTDCVEMVVVPAGQFEMGSGDTPLEKPQHRVTIANPFAIGRREVTFDEWDRCVAEGGCKYRPDDQGWGRGDRPALNLGWDDTKVFLTWLSQKTGKRYRLPSEAEWEYAARAGTTSAFWWGRDVGKGRANCEDCGGTAERRTMPTASFRPNAFGLYDTVGNVAEWIEDCWNDSYRGAPHDGSAWNSGQCRLRVLRGGSFANKASAARSAARFRYDQDVRYYANGFRVVRDLQ
jgi:formylglycine-generating enzyme required for sulfatase activity